GDTVSVSETEGTGTSLANYNSSLACDSNVIPSPNTNTAGSVTVPSIAGPVTCTFTNTRNTMTLDLPKHQIGDSAGKFNLNIGSTIVKTDAGDGQYGGTTVNVGDILSVSETAGTATSLGNYNSSLACDNGVTPNPNTNTAGSFTVPDIAGPVTCTFTNTRIA